MPCILCRRAKQNDYGALVYLWRSSTPMTAVLWQSIPTLCKFDRRSHSNFSERFGFFESCLVAPALLA